MNFTQTVLTKVQVHYVTKKIIKPKKGDIFSLFAKHCTFWQISCNEA